jgi:hypothetical protein
MFLGTRVSRVWPVHEAGNYTPSMSRLARQCGILNISQPERSPRPVIGIASPLRFEVFTTVAMKNTVFWHITQCGYCKNRRFGGTYRLHHQGDKNRQSSKQR